MLYNEFTNSSFTRYLIFQKDSLLHFNLFIIISNSTLFFFSLSLMNEPLNEMNFIVFQPFLMKRILT